MSISNRSPIVRRFSNPSIDHFSQWVQGEQIAAWKHLVPNLQFEIQLLAVIMDVNQTDVYHSGRVPDKRKLPRKFLATEWELILKEFTTPKVETLIVQPLESVRLQALFRS